MDPSQSLTDHLTELRSRIIWLGWAIVIATGVCWGFSEYIFDIVRAPITPFLESGGLIFTNPMDKFMAHMKVSVLGGVVIACPVWIYHIWRFVAPGLYAHEKKFGILFIASGTLLFLMGILFAYFLVLPTAFNFLLTFGGVEDKPMITIQEYMSFFLTMTLVFGAAFELPLILVLLGAIGLIDQAFLRSKRRYAIVGLATLAAIITPPDIISMMMLLVPLSILYELSIVLVGVFGKPLAPPSAVGDD